MKYLLEKDIESKEYIKVNLQSISKILNPHFVAVHDCVIIDIDNEIKIEKINFDRILSMFQDRTGYEASCNEMRLNDYIDLPNETAALKTAEIIMQVWENKLLLEYPQCSFCMILSIHEGYATLRFHQIRDNEQPWLDDDLESYKDEAIMTKFF